jgi:hypothetical protein
VVFTAVGKGVPAAGDDARGLRIFPEDDLPAEIVFDHARILADYFASGIGKELDR